MWRGLRAVGRILKSGHLAAAAGGEAAADGAKGEADASGGDAPSSDSSNDDVIDAEYEVKDD